ncbi:glycosyltransferase [Gardnerella vaginalis]|uniref:glycosyltransferase n=1 Tax=Gardnerella vaginalis TaxID=2702 RepID=UPI000E69D6AC|nr:glycosyltransferase [Gardnerella vaginalis]RIY23374.1 glycosyl transferase [Gardnerella vaginalis]
MKIAIFTETYPPYINGVATQSYMLKKMYEELGHEVLVVTVGSERQQKTKLVDGVVYVPGILLKKLYKYRVAIPIGNMRKKFPINFKPDVIHIQNEFGIGEIGLEVAKKEHVPVIYTLHTEYDKFLFYIGLKHFTEFSRNISAKYFTRFSKNATIITSMSAKAQAYIDRQKVDKKVVVLSNAVEYKKFLPTPERIAFRKEFRKKYGIADSTKLFVFVGRIGAEKNISELIDNFMYCDFPRELARLVVIGGGPDLEDLRKKVASKGFEDRIYLLGPIEHTQIPKYLHAMDYYTTASLSEMHSLSMLEAMASGLFALVKHDIPNENQIISGKNGYQWDSKEDFKQVFSRVLNMSEEEQAQLKANVLEYSKNNDFKKQAQELIKIYKLAIEMNNNELAKKRAAREERRARFLLKTSKNQNSY